MVYRGKGRDSEPARAARSNGAGVGAWAQPCVRKCHSLRDRSRTHQPGHVKSVHPYQAGNWVVLDEATRL